MTPHILDRPALAALRTRHSIHAQGSGRALRYDPEVAPFITAADDTAEAMADIGGLLPADRIAIMVQRERPPLPPGAAIEMQVEGVQMVAQSAMQPAGDLPVVELGADDVPEMIALATLTRPGPFLSRTYLLGGYVGIREQGRLVAMAGERFQVPGYSEVSAVCTHPDARGKGYAGTLTRLVAGRIEGRGETPFLHTFASNGNAIRLYEKLGFALRTKVIVTVLRKG